MTEIATDISVFWTRFRDCKGDRETKTLSKDELTDLLQLNEDMWSASCDVRPVVYVYR